MYFIPEGVTSFLFKSKLRTPSMATVSTTAICATDVSLGLATELPTSHLASLTQKVLLLHGIGQSYQMDYDREITRLKFGEMPSV